MLQKDIVIGVRYHAKVGGRLATIVVVRCLGQSRREIAESLSASPKTPNARSRRLASGSCRWPVGRT